MIPLTLDTSNTFHFPYLIYRNSKLIKNKLINILLFSDKIFILFRIYLISLKKNIHNFSLFNSFYPVKIPLIQPINHSSLQFNPNIPKNKHLNFILNK